MHAVRSDAFAGVERYLTYVAPELARRGHEVAVVGGDPAAMVPALAPHGVAHRPAATTAAVARALAASRPVDLVHVHMTAAEVAAVATKPLLRAPLVATAHFAAPRGGSGARRRAYRLLEPFLDDELAIGEFVAAHVGSGAVVVPNGVPDPGPGGPREPVVLLAQRLEPEKDTATAVRAWHRSGLGGRGWTLELAGSGSERARVADLVADLGVAGSVRLLGRVDDVPRRMARASILVATAPAEPFGLTVAEAMAAGLPVVAADGGGHRELLAPAGADQLVAPGDAAAFAAALVRLVDDAGARARFGAANRRRYEDEYTVERHVDRLVARYERVTRAGARVAS